ncbi:hypothetical protein JYT87_00875 [Nitrospira defluvii]|nr:hypothetical protein [Nitrospira defluvii]
MRYLTLVALSIFFLKGLVYGQVPERRKDQNPTQPAHLLVPLPYSKPGIGEGITVLGTMSNIAKTTADITGLLITGDAEGLIFNGSELPVYSDLLFLNIYYQDINRAAVNNYAKRGIGNTSKNDFTILDIGLARVVNLELNLSFFERRLNFYYVYNYSKFQVDAIRDNKGALVTRLDEPFSGSDTADQIRMSFDLTDDYLDPRKGFRFDAIFSDNDNKNSNEAEFYVLDFNLLGYLPVGKVNTVVLNYYQSDAHVRRQGNTNPASIREELGLNCDAADTGCLRSEQEIVDSFINARKNGTSTFLGGEQRLRSYPESRFQGAHMAFIGVEFRWNITVEATPFDYFIWKDVRTGYQIAFFAELGTISETGSQLWKETRDSTGIGFRLIAASGAVYRADIATGKEGVEFTVIFEYPWE